MAGLTQDEAKIIRAKLEEETSLADLAGASCPNCQFREFFVRKNKEVIRLIDYYMDMK